jgi:hypothetical protein
MSRSLVPCIGEVLPEKGVSEDFKRSGCVICSLALALGSFSTVQHWPLQTLEAGRCISNGLETQPASAPWHVSCPI